MAEYFAESGPDDPFHNDYWRATNLTPEKKDNLTNAGKVLGGNSARSLGIYRNGTNAYGYSAHAAEMTASKMAADDVMFEARWPGQPLIALARAVVNGAVSHMTELGPVYGPNPNHIGMPHGQPE